MIIKKPLAGDMKMIRLTSASVCSVGEPGNCFNGGGGVLACFIFGCSSRFVIVRYNHRVSLVV